MYHIPHTTMYCLPYTMSLIRILLSMWYFGPPTLARACARVTRLRRFGSLEVPPRSPPLELVAPEAEQGAWAAVCKCTLHTCTCLEACYTQCIYVYVYTDAHARVYMYFSMRACVCTQKCIRGCCLCAYM